YYNSSRGCRDGSSCRYPHVCKYFLSGSCRYGSGCKLSHSLEGGPSPGATRTGPDRAAASDPKLTDGRFFQWQLYASGGWKDISNDHIIEAQFSLPHNRSIKIYNTPYGAVSIDFHRMRVLGKELKVRRLDDGNTTWIWFCTLKRKWIKYGDKDSKGNPSSVKNADIEAKFQGNPRGCFGFSIGAKTFEIKFTEMRQVSTKRKRRVTRRPQYRQKQIGTGVAPLTFGIGNISLGSRPQWQFEGRGKWHEFKRRVRRPRSETLCRRCGTPTESSVTSADLETNFQQNRTGTMAFTVGGQQYKLDFAAMTQTNLTTGQARRIRRV
ncbi:uncharacterized protein si:ch211-244b2.4, partial [Cololabis saira]|uniref:uncharacterized protein si:ch211-244b2.4 n=1 Tax=Cololabis saira TaxID=129043 RepID=UPI002AD44B1C